MAIVVIFLAHLPLTKKRTRRIFAGSWQRSSSLQTSADSEAFGKIFLSPSRYVATEKCDHPAIRTKETTKRNEKLQKYLILGYCRTSCAAPILRRHGKNVFFRSEIKFACGCVCVSPPRNIAGTFRIIKPRSLATVNVPGLSLKTPDLKSGRTEKITSCVESVKSIKSRHD